MDNSSSGLTDNTSGSLVDSICTNDDSVQDCTHSPMLDCLREILAVDFTDILDDDYICGTPPSEQDEDQSEG